MKKQRLWAYVLLTVCMLMQVAEVFPHHHHAGYYCLASDLVNEAREAGCDDAMHHSDDADRHACGADCIANFQCSVQHKDVLHPVPDYSFHFIFYALSDSCRLLVPWEEKKAEYTVFPYANSLYACAFVRSTGLRAPPFIFS